MPKVLRIINRFNLGGITYNVSYLSRFMDESYETLLAGGPEEEGEESSLFIPRSLGLQPLIINEMRRSVNPLSDYFAYKKIKKLIREFKPDIVHTHASKAGAIGRLAAAHSGVPIIIHTFHGHVFKGYFGRFKTTFYKMIERYLAKRSDAIVAISDLQKIELSEEYRICPPEKITVIPLGFDLEKFGTDQELKRKQFRHNYGVADDEMAIGIIGRLAPIKNHFLFIDAIERTLDQTSRKIKAFIIGDGEMKQELLRYAAEKKCADRFVFTSWIKEVDKALSGLDIVCLTSVNEGTPVSLIEAQAASRFIVSTEVGGIRDILHPSCGLLSPSGDKNAFCVNLVYAVQNFDKLKLQAKLASSEVIEKFSYKRLCADMERLYRELLVKKKIIN